MRIAFLGNDPWSVPPLECLAAAENLEVVAVVTNPPRPAGRGAALTPTRVADTARRLGLALTEADGVRTGAGARALIDAQPDALVVVAYGELLGADTLGLARSGAINLHFSLLPRWRGASPVQRAILAGDPVTGVTVMRMDAGLDTGPVLGQLQEPILGSDDAGSLGRRLSERGGALLVQTLAAMVAGRVTPHPQDDARATLAPKLTKVERSIVWSEPAEATARRVRAFAPDPGATATFRGDVLKVIRGEVAAAVGGKPGSVAEVDALGVTIAAGEGAYRLLDLAPAGRKRMAAADWARGARPRPGERLG